ncbi:hypothetical protein ASF30_09820 [Leifsonia sp. Leaf264]|nr:hypothetical protein ASF30_09820 [Leifsonia sp. Leaf264]
MTSWRAAIDLASIMVGVLVIAVVGGILTATVFAVIPWAQDGAAKQQAASAADAESAFRGLHLGKPDATSTGYGAYQQLVDDGLLKDDIDGLCVDTVDPSGFVAITQSSTGKAWFKADSSSPEPVKATQAEFAGCSENTEALGSAQAAQAPDATMALTIDTSRRYFGASGSKCTAFALPIAGTVAATVDWGDGSIVQTVTNQYPAHTYAADKVFTIKVDGTFTHYGQYPVGSTFDMGRTGCVTVEHWGKDTGTVTTNGVYANYPAASGAARPPRTVTSYRNAFLGASTFNQNVDGWVGSNVTDMESMFNGAAAFNQPVSTWDTSQVTSFKSLFEGAAAFNQPVSAWKTPKVTTMERMFLMASAFDQDINSWDTSQVTNLNQTFLMASAFNHPLDQWKTGKVTVLLQTFKSAPNFNQDISSWNTSAVTSLGETFTGATAFNKPLESWDVSHVTDMSSAFFLATAFNQDLSSWNTARVTDMSQMFRSASSFNKPLGSWDVSKVTSFNTMFDGATVFNQDLGEWATSSAIWMSSMFGHMDAFNQDIGDWDTSNVTTMSDMFWSSRAFNQDLSRWNVAKVTDHGSFSGGSLLTPAHLPLFP